MDTIAENIDLLYKKAKEYVDVNIELVKLNTIDKIADVLSSLVSRIVIFMFIVMFILLVNIALSLYLGELFGKDYLGYGVVALIYLLFIIVLKANKDSIIKTPITNLVIAKLLKSKSMSNDSKSKEDGVL
ncbi:hypothetical protein [Flavobacterium seoulense]|uniref:Competence protein n=1 Tax=Flavobacterium seoulense TaxID=1492738 RepID=A0A066WKK2_9FLAO|nr:hypothetical protein [Flavobacterium seoulense]KDN54542.1 hypothetical protein FEM21_22650 [Flavobacterium seoulense]